MAITINPISPVAFSVFGLDVRWYALAYVAAFVIGYFMLRAFVRRPDSQISLDKRQLDDLLTAIILGVIIGGRLGYVLFYNLPFFMAHPLEIFAVWHGGMSFHGGLVGVIVAVFWFARNQIKRNQIKGSVYNTAFNILDILAVIAPVGLFFGRIANFINMEVMGRYAGWIALHSGIAGGADVILLPEIPYDINSVIRKIEERRKAGKKFSIIVVAEGAKPIGGELSVARVVEGSFEPLRLGGAGEKLVREIENRTGIESRCTVLGYLQRGGSPTAFDRVLSTRYGVAAAEACIRKEYNVMVSLQNDRIVTEPIAKVASKPRLVPVDSEIIRTGRQMGLCFGD